MAPFIFPHTLSDANRMFARHLNLQSPHPEKSIHLEQYSRALGFKKKERRRSRCAAEFLPSHQIIQVSDV